VLGGGGEGNGHRGRSAGAAIVAGAIAQQQGPGISRTATDLPIRYTRHYYGFKSNYLIEHFKSYTGDGTVLDQFGPG